jgi:hypothetical protein
VFVHGKWFCSEECGDKDPEAQQIRELYERGVDFENNDNEEQYADDEDIDL